jgi:hypothetical protein
LACVSVAEPQPTSRSRWARLLSRQLSFSLIPVSRSGVRREFLRAMSPLLLVALFFATVIVALLAFEGGLRFGRWRSRQPDPEPPLPLRTLVASIMRLLAFILGFTFGSASSHFDSRSQSIFDEAVAIGTAYHRADFLPDPEAANMRRLLREYVDLRLETSGSGDNDDAVARLRQLQQELWAQAVAAGKEDIGPLSAAPLIQSLTEVIDVQGERALAGVRTRIPFSIWVILYGIMVVSVAAAGYHAGLAGARKSVAALAYALVFAAVIVMIAAGDVPGSRQLRISHQALMDLRARLTGP